jgi:hypothetical protein
MAAVQVTSSSPAVSLDKSEFNRVVDDAIRMQLQLGKAQRKLHNLMRTIGDINGDPRKAKVIEEAEWEVECAQMGRAIALEKLNTIL